MVYYIWLRTYRASAIQTFIMHKFTSKDSSFIHGKIKIHTKTSVGEICHIHIFMQYKSFTTNTIYTQKLASQVTNNCNW